MKRGDRPYLVSLGYPSQNAPGGYFHFCGGTLIDRRVVLTAVRECIIYFYALLPYRCPPLTKILLNSNTDCLTDDEGNLIIIEGGSVNINKFDFLDSNEDVTTFLLCTNEFGNGCDLDVYAYVILNPEHDLTPGEYEKIFPYTYCVRRRIF